jgi:hypothetical protein
MTKKIFLGLFLIIHGNEFVKMHNFDVYMAPLIKELQTLWKGVATYDVAKVLG